MKEERFYAALSIILIFLFVITGIASLIFLSRGEIARQILWGIIGFGFGILAERYWVIYWKHYSGGKTMRRINKSKKRKSSKKKVKRKK